MQHGFTLLTERKLHEAGGVARLWRHDVTGAQLLSIVNDDEIEYPKRIKLTTDLQSLPSTSPERSKALWSLRLRRVDRRVRCVVHLL